MKKTVTYPVLLWQDDFGKFWFFSPDLCTQLPLYTTHFEKAMERIKNAIEHIVVDRFNLPESSNTKLVKDGLKAVMTVSVEVDR